jgi:hypothetical protein
LSQRGVPMAIVNAIVGAIAVAAMVFLMYLDQQM